MCVVLWGAAAPAWAAGASAPQGVPQDVYQKAQRIAAELRCPVCTGQSLVESDSEVARQMRAKIVEMVQQGKSREEILAYFVGQYGEWILNAPPARGAGLVPWLVPPAVLVAGAAVLVWFVRRRAKRVAASPAAAPAPPGDADPDAEALRKVRDHLRDYL